MGVAEDPENHERPRRRANARSRALADIPEAEWQEACRRESIIRPLAALKRLSEAAVADACDVLQLRETQLYEMLRRFRADPSVTSLALDRPGPRKGAIRLDPEVLAVVQRCIRDFYLTPQKLSVTAVHKQIERACRAAGLATPHITTVKRRIGHLPVSLRMRAREGAEAARKRLAPVPGSLDTEYPLDVVQIDHTLMDVVVVDDDMRRSIGRVWLTLVFDVDSRMVCGFWISPEPPSTTSVALALAHAVLPKAPWLEQNKLALPWPAAGLPRCLHVDNAREFHSTALKRACQQHGIVLRHRPVAQPHWGGHIERMMGTLMRRIHELPGTTFSNIRDRGDADPEANAVLTLSELQRIFALEVLGRYHNEVHSTLGIPPLAAWAERLDRRPSPPVIPHDPREFLCSFLPFKEVTIRREGIRLHNIFYYDDVLTTWLGKDTRRMRVKYDPRDLSCVYLEDSTGRHWPIRYRNLRRPPITLWEQRAAVRDLRERGRGLANEQAIFESTDASRAIVAEAVARTKAARRSRQRIAHLTSPARSGVAEGRTGGPTSLETPSEATEPDVPEVPLPSAESLNSLPLGSACEQHQAYCTPPMPFPAIDDARVPLPYQSSPEVEG
jgi:putative transposase